MAPCRVVFSFVCVASLAAATAGCSGGSGLFDKSSDSGMFSKPFAILSRDDGSKATSGLNVSLNPSGPVGPEELVGADGRCAPAAVAMEGPSVQPIEPAPVVDRPVGSVAGDLAGAPMPAAVPRQDQGVDPAGQPQLGGIALGMTECEAVRRAGLASNVLIGADEAGSRKVVLTYLGGTWPGIYTFASGRLREISRAPEQPKPAKPAPKAKAKNVPAKKPPVRTAPPTQIR